MKDNKALNFYFYSYGNCYPSVEFVQTKFWVGFTFQQIIVKNFILIDYPPENISSDKPYHEFIIQNVGLTTLWKTFRSDQPYHVCITQLKCCLFVRNLLYDTCVGGFIVFLIQVVLKWTKQMVVGWRKVRRVWWMHKNFSSNQNFYKRFRLSV